MSRAEPAVCRVAELEPVSSPSRGPVAVLALGIRAAPSPRSPLSFLASSASPGRVILTRKVASERRSCERPSEMSRVPDRCRLIRPRVFPGSDPGVTMYRKRTLSVADAAMANSTSCGLGVGLRML